MRSRLVVTSLVVLSSFALAACGGDDSADRPETATAGDEFCVAAEAADTAGDAAGTALDSGDPAAIEAAINEAVDKGKAAAALSPTDIEEVTSTVVEAQEALQKVLADNDWDVMKAITAPELQAVIENQEYADANDALDEYLADKCGIAID